MPFSPVCLICFTTRRKICTQDTATATEVWFHSHIALLGDFTSWHALGISKQSPYREGICSISYMLNDISLSIYEWPDRRKHMQICHIWPVPINILIQYSILHFGDKQDNFAEIIPFWWSSSARRGTDHLQQHVGLNLIELQQKRL